MGSPSDNLPNPVRWTLYNYCGVQDGKNYECTDTSAAFPFTPQTAFGTTEGIPQDFIENRDTYYYLTRISYGFYIAVIFFTVVALFLTFFGCISRLGSALAAALTFLALLFQMATSAMETAAYVMARNKLNDAGYDAHLGVKMMAFTWTATACLLLAFILLTMSCCSKRDKNRRRRESVLDDDDETKSGGFFGLGRKGKKKNYASSFERSVEPPSNHPLHAGFFKMNRKRDNDASSYYAEQGAPPPTTTTAQQPVVVN